MRGESAAQKNKFISAHTAYEIIGSYGAFQDTGGFFQNTVSLNMTAGIIDIFETVQISNEKPGAVFYGLWIEFFKSAIIDQICQSVFLGKKRKEFDFFFFSQKLFCQCFGISFPVSLLQIGKGMMDMDDLPAGICIFIKKDNKKY